MTFELVFTLALIAVVTVLFFTERLSAPVTAMLALGALLLAGIVPPDAAFSGFSNAATVTVIAMFVLSAGIQRTGAVTVVGDRLAGIAAKSFRRGLTAIVACVGGMSAFINNTAVVTLLLPTALRAARDARTSPSKVLIPLSFASMLGGTCTLVGTSTNLLVDSIAVEEGARPLELFDFLPLGVVFFVVGGAYLLLIAPRLLPDTRGTGTSSETFGMVGYVTAVVLEAEAPSIGRRLGEAPLLEDLDCDVLALSREGLDRSMPDEDLILEAGDVLRLRCDAADVPRLLEREGVRVATLPASVDIESSEAALVEVVIGARSRLDGRKIDEAEFREEYGAIVLAVRARGELHRNRLSDVRLKAGDVLLLQIEKDHLDQVRKGGELVFVSEVEMPRFRSERALVALGIVVSVVLLAAFDVLPIVAAATGGALAMVLTGCVGKNEAIDAIDFDVVFLLGGLFPLGIAMNVTGADDLLAEGLLAVAGSAGPRVVIGSLFVVTTLLTSVISNNGAGALLTPLALSCAGSLDVEARPFVMAVAFGASTSFLTPVGYQTNLLVYGAGHYRFSDFVRVGGPLCAALAILATWLIPVFWPF